MPTISLQVSDKKNGPTKKGETYAATASVGSAPGRYYYATIGGRDRTLEFVGTDASGNAVYRDQNRY